MTRIALLTTHLSGTGHFVRSLAIARALQAAGAEVRLINGGRPLRHIPSADVPITDVPPLLVLGRDFATLRDGAGTPVSAPYLGWRKTAVAEAVGGFMPDLLVTETYPLGRRKLASEFEAAIEAAGPARLVASVRDVPEPPSKPARLEEAAARLDRYDALLVHGDEGFLPLSASWDLPPPARDLVRYTGYVAEPMPTPAPDHGAVLVAVGGGDVGRDVLGMAAGASRYSARSWHLLVGGGDVASTVRALRAGYARAEAQGRLAIEPLRSDYRALLAGAVCSVSLAGYNTITDLAPLDTPAVLIADETGGEREQAIRARALADMPGIKVLPQRGLTEDMLGSAVESVAGTRRPPLPITLDGAARSADILLRLAREGGG